MKKKILSLLLAVGLLCSGCGQTPAETTPPETTLPPETTVPETTAPAETEPKKLEKQVIVYFANWYLDTKTAEEGAEVCSIPWENITCINHAFFEVQPDDGSTETSFQRRDAKQPARTKFKIASTLPKADFEDQTPSTMAEGLPRNHFAQYAAYSEKYPDVNILISIGGWTRCGYFSEMAYTPEGRTSFVKACIALMKEYPWIDGIDIDWEYFGGSKDGERKPEDEIDQGCPIWGTVEEDSENFAALAKELRETMDQEFGKGTKLLTGCASASTGWTLPMQSWRLVAPYMDFINIMSYDMNGVWDHMTGHASKMVHAKDAVSVLNLGHNIPYEKLVIGTPMYGTDLKLLNDPEGASPVARPIEAKPPCKEEITQEMMRGWEKEAVSGFKTEWVDGKPVMGEKFDKGGKGWHFDYDVYGKGTYLFNDDPQSPYYLWYLSYETPVTLQEKLDYINSYDVAGIMMWESSQDTYDHQMVRQMADNLLKK